MSKFKNYTVTLEEEIVDSCRENSEFFGGKLSPVINSLLKEWLQKLAKEKKVG